MDILKTIIKVPQASCGWHITLPMQKKRKCTHKHKHHLWQQQMQQEQEQEQEQPQAQTQTQSLTSCGTGRIQITKGSPYYHKTYV